MTISITVEQPNLQITCFHASDPNTTTHEATIDSGFDMSVGFQRIHLSTDEAYRLGCYLKNEQAEGGFINSQILQDAADRLVANGGVTEEMLGTVVDEDGITHTGIFPEPKQTLTRAEYFDAQERAKVPAETAPSKISDVLTPEMMDIDSTDSDDE